MWRWTKRALQALFAVFVFIPVMLVVMCILLVRGKSLEERLEDMERRNGLR